MVRREKELDAALPAWSGFSDVAIPNFLISFFVSQAFVIVSQLRLALGPLRIQKSESMPQKKGEMLIACLQH